VTAAALGVSGLGPTDRLTWILEVAPVLIAMLLLTATRRRFPLTTLTYRLIFAHAMLLIVGAHYTFSHVPIGAWLQETLGFARNHYDRIVHFAGGLAPSILAREILLRKTPLRPGRWLFLLVALSCLAGGAVYELLEWAAALFTGGEASAVLATQGDVWDTQWDLLLGLIGACAGQLLLGRRHQSELEVAGFLDSLPD
jgi:putative membrane protein